MTSKIVISTPVVPEHVAGALIPRPIEPKAGLYVGVVPARACDELSSVIVGSIADGAAPSASTPPTPEQDFTIKAVGGRRRHVMDFGSLQLLGLPSQQTQETLQKTRSERVLPTPVGVIRIVANADT
ncbi:MULTISPECIES: type I-E CRISPR-associated endoribonuclease Cas2 [unclassified Frankia]